MKRSLLAAALAAGISFMGLGGWLVAGSSPFPMSISLSLSSVSNLPDNTAQNITISTANVVMSDGSPFPGQISTNDPQFPPSGLNVVTAAPPLTDGTHNFVVSASPTVQATLPVTVVAGSTLTIVVHGDSITAGAGLSSSALAYPNVLAVDLTNNNRPAVSYNFGDSGAGFRLYICRTKWLYA